MRRPLSWLRMPFIFLRRPFISVKRLFISVKRPFIFVRGLLLRLAFYELDKIDVQLFNKRKLDVVVAIGRFVPRLTSEIILKILRLEAIPVSGEDGIAHQAEGRFVVTP